MKIGLEILPDNSVEVCDRCRSKEWARIALLFTPSLSDTGAIEFPSPSQMQHVAGRTLRVIMCIDCLAHAIQSVTGWNIRKLLERYRTVSPLYGTVGVSDEEPEPSYKLLPPAKKAKAIRHKFSKKGKR